MLLNLKAHLLYSIHGVSEEVQITKHAPKRTFSFMFSVFCLRERREGIFEVKTDIIIIFFVKVHCIFSIFLK